MATIPNKDSQDTTEDIVSFLQTLCHELATPLSLLMAVDDIEQTNFSKSDAANFEDIRVAKDALLQILKNLKTLRAPEAEEDSIFYLSEVASFASEGDLSTVQLQGKQKRYRQFFLATQKHFPILSCCETTEGVCILTLKREAYEPSRQHKLVESGIKLLACSCDLEFSHEKNDLRIFIRTY